MPMTNLAAALPLRPAVPGPAIWAPVAEPPAAAFRRGALAVTADPPAVLRHGAPLMLSPAEAALIALLVRRGRASHEAIEAVLEAAGAKLASLDVLVHRIRRKFAAAAAPDPIARLRSWGLTLRVEPDARGSTGLWIGGLGH